MWGFKEGDPIDQTGVNLIFDADFKGVPNYAAGFELSSSAQTALLDVCDILEAAEATKTEVDTTTGNSTVLVACFMRAFRDYRAMKGLPFPIASAADAADGLEAWLEDKGTDVPRAMRGQPYETDIGWTKEGEALKLRWLKVRAQAFHAPFSRSAHGSSQYGLYFSVSALHAQRVHDWRHACDPLTVCRP